MSQALKLFFIAIAIFLGCAWAVAPEDASSRMLAGMNGEAFAFMIPAAGNKPPEMTSHKALYTYKMVSVESGAGVTGIRGKMYFEQDDACDAWTTDQRFTTEYQYPERRPVVNNSHYVAWEAKDQSIFHFSSERQENGILTEQLRGSVERAPDGSTQARYSRPDNLSFELPKGYMLPTWHTAEIIRLAREGKKLFNAVMFDGTDAEGPVEVNAFIGKKATSEEIKQAIGNAKADMSLLSADAWHVRLALFPLDEKETFSPAYEMDMILHDNGIVSWALVDYKNFKVEQILSALEKLPAKKCP